MRITGISPFLVMVYKVFSHIPNALAVSLGDSKRRILSFGLCSFMTIVLDLLRLFNLGLMCLVIEFLGLLPFVTATF